MKALSLIMASLLSPISPKPSLPQVLTPPPATLCLTNPHTLRALFFHFGPLPEGMLNKAYILLCESDALCLT